MRRKAQLLVALILSVFIVSCGGNTEKKVEKEKKFKIGQRYQGGFIFFIDTTNEHGLIVAETDQGLAAWSPKVFELKGTKTKFGSGTENTKAMLNAGSDPAKMCDTLHLGGFDDWYLPSKDEIKKIWESFKDSDTLDFRKSITKANYWTSSEYDKDYAWSIYFGSGVIGCGNKLNGCYVRAIRAF
jgi:hypothetical protein